MDSEVLIVGAGPTGLTLAIDAMTAEGERVAVEAHSRGEHVSGEVYSNNYHFLFVFRAGRLALLREYAAAGHSLSLL